MISRVPQWFDRVTGWRRGYRSNGASWHDPEMRLLFSSFHRHGGKSAFIAIFMLCAVPLGLRLAVITPLGQSPDEPAQVARAAGLLHGAILGVRKSGINGRSGRVIEQAGVKVDTGIFAAGFGVTTPLNGHQIVTAQDFAALRAEPPNHIKSFADIPNTVQNFPTAYVPAALGMALGLLLHASPFTCVLMARIGMLIAFLVLGSLSLLVAAYGEAVLLTVLLLPMTVFLASMVNQDGVLIGATCLACAALTRNTRGFWWLGLAMFTAVLASKPPYIAMLGVFLLPLFGKNFWRRAGGVAVACLPVLLWAALIAIFVAVPYDTSLYHPGSLFAGDHSIWMDRTNAAMNLHILLAQPERFFTLPVATVQQNGIQNLREMIGVLGSLQVMLPDLYYLAWGVCGMFALSGLVFCRRPNIVPPNTAAVNFFFTGFLFALTFWLILITQYLDWAHVGAAQIDGVEGRYGLILLPFLLFMLPKARLPFALPRLLPAIPTIILGLYDLSFIPMQIIRNYYLY